MQDWDELTKKLLVERKEFLHPLCGVRTVHFYECMDGWHPIINKTLALMERRAWHNNANIVRDLVVNQGMKMGEIDKSCLFEVSQVKEKFGRLRIYYSGCVDPYLDGLVNLAEQMSLLTCEITGSTTGVRTVRIGKGIGRIITLCEEKIKKFVDEGRDVVTIDGRIGY
jgi:hypothetical protein